MLYHLDHTKFSSSILSCMSENTQRGMNKDLIKNLFPVFNELELLNEVSEIGIEKTFQKGDKIIRKGEYMKYMPLVISGSLKVMREDDHGNEMLLYYLEGGNTCAMSITCCMKQEKSNVWAFAEDDKTEILLLPIQNIDGWMKKYTSWRNFILNSYSSRMDQLLHTLDAIAFYSLDERLIKYLKDRSTALNKTQFSITHSDIAKELNSSREAVSRLLKKLEVLNKVKLGRNQIALINI